MSTQRKRKYNQLGMGDTHTPESPRKKVKLSHEIHYNELSHNDLQLINLLQIDALLQPLCGFIDIHDIHNLCKIRAELSIGISGITQSSQIVRSGLLSIYEESDYEYVRQISNNSCNDIKFRQIIKQHIGNDCIFAHQHPFSLWSSNSNMITNSNCIKLHQIPFIPPVSFDVFNYLKRNRYFMYQLFKTISFEKFNEIFKNNPVCHYLKLHLPYTDNVIPDEYIFKVHHKELCSMIESCNFNSNSLKCYHNNNWISFSVYCEYNLPCIRSTIEEEIPIHGKCIPDYLENVYSFSKWQRTINWNVFFLSGDCIVNSLVPGHKFIESRNIDIFSLNLSSNEYQEEINDIFTNLQREEILFNMTRVHPKITTFILIINDYIHIKIQFVYTCKYSTIATFLSKHALGVSQIAYRPNTGDVLFTDAFLYWVKTSHCLIFNSCKLNQRKKNRSLFFSLILNHLSKGIKQYQIPYSCGVIDLFVSKFQAYYTKVKSNDDKSKTGLCITINGERHFVNLQSDRSDASCGIIGGMNPDELNLLSNFIKFIRNQYQCVQL